MGGDPIYGPWPMTAEAACRPGHSKDSRGSVPADISLAAPRSPFGHRGGCQNYGPLLGPLNTGPLLGPLNTGPLLGPLNTRCRIILRTHKGTIILTTTHMIEGCSTMVLIRYDNGVLRVLQI